jgi:hypothetical protein
MLDPVEADVGRPITARPTRMPASLSASARWPAALLAAVAALALSARAAAAQLVTYDPPPGVAAAPDFRVWIGGRELFLYDTEVAAVGIFSFAGDVEVVVRPTHDVRRVDVRPLSAGVRPDVRPNEIRFRLRAPHNLSVELNGESRRVLNLFAAPLERDVPSPDDPGVRYFAPGRVHDAGEVTLRSGETAYIAGGAVVRGAFRASGGRGVRIRGRGIVDGTHLPEGVRMVTLDSVRDALVEGVTFLNSGTWTVVPFLSDGFRADNVKILNWRTGSDGIDLVATSHAVVENSFVRANDDCVVVKTWGGGPRYPGGMQAAGPDVSDILVRNSVFWNMPWGNALEIGFELRAARVRGIRFVDNDIIRVDRGAALSIHNGEGAEVSDVLFEDIRIEDARHKLLDLAVVFSQYSLDRPAEQAERTRLYMQGAWDGVLRTPPGAEAEHARHRGTIRNVTLRNVAIVDGPVPFSVIAGYDDAHRVEGVRFENLTFHGRRVRDAQGAKLSAEHARGITFR